MAVNWNETAGVDRTGNGGYTVPPENVILKPELSGRSEETDVTELAEDIKNRKEGQLVPGICYKSPDGWPVLIAGHRRLRAIVLLNRDIPEPENKIKFKFNYSPARNDEEALDLTVAENRNRTDTNPLDDSYNIGVYIAKFGKGLEEVAKKYFPGSDTPEKLAKAVAWVKERQKLLELSPEAQEKLRKGEFSTSAALQLAKLQPVDQNKTIKAQEEKGKKLKVADAKAAVEAKAPAPAKERKQIKDSTPVKLLKKFQIFAEVSSSLATEIMAKRFGRVADKDVIAELCDQILIMAYKLKIPQDAAADTWASNHNDILTAIDKVDGE